MFAEPAFLWFSPLALLPLLLLLRRRREVYAVRPWGSMWLLQAAATNTARQYPWRDVLVTILRMLFVIALVLLTAAPKWQDKLPRENILNVTVLDETNSPHVQLALESLGHKPLASNAFLQKNSVIFLGEKSRAERYSFTTPQTLTLALTDNVASDSAFLQLGEHLSKFGCTVQHLWKLTPTHDQVSIKPLLVGIDERGERHTLLSLVENNTIVWHISPEAAASSLGSSVLLPPLVDASLRDAGLALRTGVTRSAWLERLVWWFSPTITLAVVATLLLIVEAWISRRHAALL